MVIVSIQRGRRMTGRLTDIFIEMSGTAKTVPL